MANTAPSLQVAPDALPAPLKASSGRISVCSGWLFKQGWWNSTWKPRFFDLHPDGSFLSYYVSEDAESPQGSIDLLQGWCFCV